MKAIVLLVFVLELLSFVCETQGGSYIQLTTNGFGDWSLKQTCLQFNVNGVNYTIATDSEFCRNNSQEGLVRFTFSAC